MYWGHVSTADVTYWTIGTSNRLLYAFQFRQVILTRSEWLLRYGHIDDIIMISVIIAYFLNSLIYLQKEIFWIIFTTVIACIIQIPGHMYRRHQHTLLCNIIVCMYVYVLCVSVCVFMCSYMRNCVRVCVSCVYVLCVYIIVCTYHVLYMSILYCMYLYLCTVHAYTYTYMHTHTTDTYIHIHIY